MLRSDSTITSHSCACFTLIQSRDTLMTETRRKLEASSGYPLEEIFEGQTANPGKFSCVDYCNLNSCRIELLGSKLKKHNNKSFSLYVYPLLSFPPPSLPLIPPSIPAPFTPSPSISSSSAPSSFYLLFEDTMVSLPFCLTLPHVPSTTSVFL